jgi:molecular chaperone DnaK (HSP70)
VSKALDDAGKLTHEIDAIVLVGGSTRTPLVTGLLRERTGIEPRQDVHPDLCVALGAGVLASRLGGHEVERVLVDVSPYSFGPSYLGERGGVPYPHCYHPIIHRNTPLPITRSESYYTSAPYQTEVQVEVFQGDDEDALKNIPVGRFRIDGLRPVEEPNEVLCRMSLDLDGILHVTATEKDTGKSKNVIIRDAFAVKTPEQIAAARRRLEELYAAREEDFELAEAGDEEVASEAPAQDLHGREEAEKLLARSRGLLGTMHADDVEEAVALHERIAAALAGGDAVELQAATEALRELLFFLEGK